MDTMSLVVMDLAFPHLPSAFALLFVPLSTPLHQFGHEVEEREREILLRFSEIKIHHYQLTQWDLYAIIFFLSHI